jgi:hypothetical protein
MNSGDSYRIVAADLDTKAKLEKNASVALEFERLSLAYRRLAEQADRNSAQDISVAFDPEPGNSGSDEG